MTVRLAGIGLAALALAAAGAAQAQGVVLAGRMGERALLVIDGRPHTLAVGQAAAGVRLLRWAGDTAEVERAGATHALRLGGAPAQIGTAPAPIGGREIVITAGPGGHFTAGGSVNGRAARFMVDTGATMVSIGRDDAQRLGLDLSGARSALTQTANGPVVVQSLTLGSLRVGEVELNNIQAIVLPTAMPYVLLGNSWIGRFQMRRENDVMRLELR
ncbi:MAG: TIGR02281 family clan AA aspartic protease [Rubrivivax sp.]|nr:TIGR02281 family clan AA aspartic protease [Rubrivivax sp.]